MTRSSNPSHPARWRPNPFAFAFSFNLPANWYRSLFRSVQDLFHAQSPSCLWIFDLETCRPSQKQRLWMFRRPDIPAREWSTWKSYLDTIPSDDYPAIIDDWIILATIPRVLRAASMHSALLASQTARVPSVSVDRYRILLLQHIQIAISLPQFISFAHTHTRTQTTTHILTHTRKCRYPGIIGKISSYNNFIDIYIHVLIVDGS